MVAGSNVERGIVQLVEDRLREYWPKWPSGYALLRLPNTCARRVKPGMTMKTKERPPLLSFRP